MAIIVSEETKESVVKKYKRCYKIEIKSTKADDGTVTETVAQWYESIVELDSVVVSRSHVAIHEYRCDQLLAIKWDAPWKAGITGLDVMAFIKWFNDNYEAALAQLTPPATEPLPEQPVTEPPV